MAAARKPEQSTGLVKLKKQYGAALQLVKLDVNDGASVTVRTGVGLSAVLSLLQCIAHSGKGNFQNIGCKIVYTPCRGCLSFF